MKTFQVRARTQSGKSIGQYIVEIETDDPLGETDTLEIIQELDNAS